MELDAEDHGHLEYSHFWATIHSLPEDATLSALLDALEDLIPSSRRPARLSVLGEGGLAGALRALDIEELRCNLRGHLAAKGAGVRDFVWLLDEQGVLKLSARDWKNHLQRLGFVGNVEVLDRAFAEITAPLPGEDSELISSNTPLALLKLIHDRFEASKRGHGTHGSPSVGKEGGDGMGGIMPPLTWKKLSSQRPVVGASSFQRIVSFHELFAWLTGERLCLDHRRRVSGLDAASLRLAISDVASGEVRDLRALDWSQPTTLRQELQRVCRDLAISPTELLYHWTAPLTGGGPPGHDTAITRRDLLIVMKRMVAGDLTLWDDHVRMAVTDAFDLLSNGSRPTSPALGTIPVDTPGSKSNKTEIPLFKLSAWLEEGWKDPLILNLFARPRKADPVDGASQREMVHGLLPPSGGRAPGKDRETQEARPTIFIPVTQPVPPSSPPDAAAEAPLVTKAQLLMRSRYPLHMTPRPRPPPPPPAREYGDRLADSAQASRRIPPLLASASTSRSLSRSSSPINSAGVPRNLPTSPATPSNPFAVTFQSPRRRLSSASRQDGHGTRGSRHPTKP